MAAPAAAWFEPRYRRRFTAGPHLLLLLLVFLFTSSADTQRINRNKNKGGGGDTEGGGAGGNSTDPDFEVVETSTGPPLTGNPQIDYIHDPNLPHELMGYDLSDYPFYKRVPKEGHNFTCDGRHDGFYASIPHKCQVYYNCLFSQRYDFLCANYTVFDQVNFICHYASEVDCKNSEKFYDRNEELYVTTSTTTTTVAPPQVIFVNRPRPRPIRPLNVRRPQPQRRRRPLPQQDPVDYKNAPAAQDAQYYDEYGTNDYADDYYDDYYYDAPLAIATTSTTTRRPVRKRLSRPGGAVRGGYIDEGVVGGGRRRGGGGDGGGAAAGGEGSGGRRRQRPRNGGGGGGGGSDTGGRRRRVKTTTSTTTAAPVDYYDDYYYYDEDTVNNGPSNPKDPTATTTQAPLAQLQGPRDKPGQRRKPSFRRSQSSGLDTLTEHDEALPKGGRAGTEEGASLSVSEGTPNQSGRFSRRNNQEGIRGTPRGGGNEKADNGETPPAQEPPHSQDSVSPAAGEDAHPAAGTLDDAGAPGSTVIRRRLQKISKSAPSEAGLEPVKDDLASASDDLLATADVPLAPGSGFGGRRPRL